MCESTRIQIVFVGPVRPIVSGVRISKADPITTWYLVLRMHMENKTESHQNGVTLLCLFGESGSPALQFDDVHSISELDVDVHNISELDVDVQRISELDVGVHHIPQIWIKVPPARGTQNAILQARGDSYHSREEPLGKLKYRIQKIMATNCLYHYKQKWLPECR